MVLLSPVVLSLNLYFQHGGSWRRKSLIEDAKFETAANIEFEKQERKSRGGSISEEEEVFLSQQNGDVISSPEKDVTKHQSIIMMSLKDGMTSLSRILRIFEVCSIHLITRKRQLCYNTFSWHKMHAYMCKRTTFLASFSMKLRYKYIFELINLFDIRNYKSDLSCWFVVARPIHSKAPPIQKLF